MATFWRVSANFLFVEVAFLVMRWSEGLIEDRLSFKQGLPQTILAVLALFVLSRAGRINKGALWPHVVGWATLFTVCFASLLPQLIAHSIAVLAAGASAFSCWYSYRYPAGPPAARVRRRTP